ncbi:MAG: hypothetical protein E7774_10300 [Bradyrhizobium sp.]|nr:MAG: hypothetical protein E7774_10300 [Bradyrhizobium sp.]
MSDQSRWLEALEPDQFVAATETPLPRRKLSRGVLVLLIALRIYVFITAPIVVYAFVRALLTP